MSITLFEFAKLIIPYRKERQPMCVNNNIKTIRNKKKVIREDLARVLKCSTKSIERYESGERSPSIEMAMRIARYLEVGLEDLFYFDDEDQEVQHG